MRSQEGILQVDISGHIRRSQSLDDIKQEHGVSAS
jgi:hypothetical protein